MRGFLVLLRPAPASPTGAGQEQDQPGPLKCTELSRSIPRAMLSAAADERLKAALGQRVVARNDRRTLRRA